MIFEKLTYDTLLLLRFQGYTILTSKNQICDDNVIWYADKLLEIKGYLDGDRLDWMHSIDECQILVIEDVVNYNCKFELKGHVFIWL